MTLHAINTAVNRDTTTGIEIRRLAPALGAELSGIDLGAGVDDATFAVIHAALMEHQVIFFRDQDLPVERQLELARRFGNPTYSKKLPKYEGHDYVSLIESDGTQANVGGRWHTDNTDFVAPPMGSVLYAEETPSVGGDTLFSSMYAAYEALSPGLRAHIDGLVAQHDNNLIRLRFIDRADLPATGLDVPPPVLHPVVRVHPVTGRRALFVNSSYTRRIPSVSDVESRHLLALLMEQVMMPEFQVRFQWRPGSVAIWDNRCTQHFASNDYREKRRMRRVQIDGDEPRGISG
ncbi:TauD/TfdA dioxygenase family protein [Oceanibacterium hippocampi]|uniref:Alpha-ketoglutarate-dependent taurine dioxygenase n=1 Tax=Oceanibacterium hippocampi TaxID=745714 RepID=A0A1Y5TTZ2_9PROT|nr:TauD/TfdA family dioxygenase [Oceanibacterium hippocampi]SLN72557.1 Alpha-ketoglutarate-dependent taurine dioxygenase [Oceanibacterium hippocampi]